jgi:hypothetical protein
MDQEATSLAFATNLGKTFFILLTSLPFLHGPIQAHDEQPVDLLDVGITAQVGHSIPLNLLFNEEKGDTVNIRQCVRGPTILALVHLHFPDA